MEFKYIQVLSGVPWARYRFLNSEGLNNIARATVDQFECPDSSLIKMMPTSRASSISACECEAFACLVKHGWLEPACGIRPLTWLIFSLLRNPTWTKLLLLLHTIAANVCQGQQILDGRNSALHVHSNTVRVNFFHAVVTFVMHVTDFSTGLTVVQKYIQSQGTVLMNKLTMPKNIIS